MQIGEGTRLGAYRIVRKLGEGGMGAVYEGVHERLQKRVAIKTLHEAIARDADAVARFVREGRAASRIRHPHVVDVTDVGTEDGTPYLVMELLDGESLASFLSRSGPLAIATIADIALPVLDALQAAHSAGIIHRDLKPENVFLSRSHGGDMHPSVVDFGISRIEDEVRLTKTAHFMGTPYYMSPEQAQSARAVDARSDQFSLGLVFFELATGRRALAGGSVLEIVHRVSTEGAPRLSYVRGDLPPSFTAIVDRMTEKQPERRFSSMREVGASILPFASPRVAALWSAAFGGATPTGPLMSQRPVMYGANALSAQSSPSFRPPAMSGAPPSSRPPAPSFAPTRSASFSQPSFSQPPPQPSAVGTDPTMNAPKPSSVPPANTTFSSAARESVASRERPRSRAPLIVLAILGIAGIGGASYFLGTHAMTLAAIPAPVVAPPVVPPAPPPETPPVVTAPPPVPAAPIEVRLRAVPATAEIVLDGNTVGLGTYAGTLPRDGIPHLLEVRAEGFIPHRIQFLDIAPVAEIVLEAIPRHHRGAIVPRMSHMTETGMVAGPPVVVAAPPVVAVIPPHETAPGSGTVQVGPHAVQSATGAGQGPMPAPEATTATPTPPPPEVAPPPEPPPVVAPTAPAPPPRDDWGSTTDEDEIVPFGE